eukprot:scaffold6648_cov120-Skeletonema_menzelii.AAC.1
MRAKSFPFFTATAVVTGAAGAGAAAGGATGAAAGGADMALISFPFGGILICIESSCYSDA